MENSVDPDQTAPKYVLTLYAYILKFISNFRQFLQQTTSADDIFRCIFLGPLWVICPYIGQD